MKPETREFARDGIVFTPVRAQPSRPRTVRGRVLQWYPIRRQTAPLLKHLKSIARPGLLPGDNPGGTGAWPCGTSFTALRWPCPPGI